MEVNTKHILIVEDDDFLRDELAHTFAEEGYGVSTAKTGEEGLDLALSKMPDLIVLDILMPGMDGLQMLKKLRADERGKSLSVLILSNLKDQETIAQVLEIGSSDYLLKADWTLADVVDKVKEKMSS